MAGKKTKGATRTASKQAKPPAGGRGKLRERALGPAADKFGTEVAPLGKEAGAVTVKVGRMLLGMVSGAVYGIEQVSIWLKDAVAKRLSEIPPETIVEPNPRIAIPAVQALVYSMNDEVIRELFANLLAADMTSDSKSNVHPAFVELIKEMTLEDAQILEVLSLSGMATVLGDSTELKTTWRGKQRSIDVGKWHIAGDRLADLYGSSNGDAYTAAVSNLSRLGLLELTTEPPDEEDDKSTVRFGLLLTPLGRSFVGVCLPRKK